jgi:hypothetical protein
MSEFIDGSPPPKNHLTTLSRVGYTFTSAVGDLIDNSIAAGSQNISILFKLVDKLPAFIITDDGCGMNSQELKKNMVIGCKDPDDQREEKDLGRFGSGLKTASFSQARLLTVISQTSTDSTASAARWDTDLIKEKNEWRLEILAKKDIANLTYLIDFDNQNSGTVVCLQALTCIDNNPDVSSQISSLCNELTDYIQLYFHRFLNRSIKLKLNGVSISGLDPFMKKLPGYQELGLRELRTKKGKIVIQSHVLPRITSLTQNQLAQYKGAKHISQHQGLYIYRDKRLILAGGWFGIGNMNELSNLVRIQIDIPSELDKEWETDVKKSQLKIPLKVRQILKRILGSPISTSKRVHNYVGKKDEDSKYWEIQQNELSGSEETKYLINKDNDLLKKFTSTLNTSERQKLAKYLCSLANNLPINHIYMTMASTPKSITRSDSDIDYKNFLEALSE